MLVNLSKRQIKKLDGKFHKLMKQEYGLVSDIYWAEISRVSYDADVDMTILYLRYGWKIADGKEFQHDIKITLINGNLHFIAGQFFQCLCDADGNKI